MLNHRSSIRLQFSTNLAELPRKCKTKFGLIQSNSFDLSTECLPFETEIWKTLFELKGGASSVPEKINIGPWMFCEGDFHSKSELLRTELKCHQERTGEVFCDSVWFWSVNRLISVQKKFSQQLENLWTTTRKLQNCFLTIWRQIFLGSRCTITNSKTGQQHAGSSGQVYLGGLHEVLQDSQNT